MADPRLLRRRDLPDWPLRRWVRWRYCWWAPTWAEVRTGYLDAGAWLTGWCNRCPRTDEPSGGGYPHWRCQLRRSHSGLHRSKNYVWATGGEVEHSPQNADYRIYSPWAEKVLVGAWRHRLRRQAQDYAAEHGRRRTR